VAKRGFTIEDIKNSKVADLNQHIFNKEPQKRLKFCNSKVEIDGCMVDSKKESRRYVELKQAQAYGFIHSLQVHPVFVLSVCKYIANLDGKFIIEDVKSKVTRKISTYRLKKKLMKNELDLEITEI
jgi:hypothetical protein